MTGVQTCALPICAKSSSIRRAAGRSASGGLRKSRVGGGGGKSGSVRPPRKKTTPEEVPSVSDKAAPGNKSGPILRRRPLGRRFR